MQDNQNNTPCGENDNINNPDNQDIDKNAEAAPNAGEPISEENSTAESEAEATEPSNDETEAETTEPVAEEPDNEEAEAETTEPMAEAPDNEEAEATAESKANDEDAKYAFEWNYTTLTPENKKAKNSRKIGLIFGLSLGGVIALAIVALVVAIIFGILSGTFSIFGQTVDYNTQINVSDNGTTIDDPQDASSADLEAFKASVVVIICDSSTGTGIILGENGMIVTNHHVIENATTISVYLYDGRNYSATLIGSDSYNDIAVIKINVPNSAPALQPATFGNSENVYTGERVYAVGTPAGHEFAWSVSAGIVSHPYRELNFYNTEGQLERSLFLIQTDALVNPGNSGGPLINKRCEVIGIVNMRLSDDYVGIGFAIPTNVALPIIENIITSYIPSPIMTILSPQIGVKCIAVQKGEKFIMSAMGFKNIVTDDYYDRNLDRCKYASNAGIYILDVTEGFDAYGKLQEDDIIIAAGKYAVESIDDLHSAIESKRTGDTLRLTIIRDNKQLSIDIVLSTT